MTGRSPVARRVVTGREGAAEEDERGKGNIREGTN